MRWYFAFGMHIESEIELHLPVGPAWESPDVSIRFGESPECQTLPYSIDSIRYGAENGFIRVRVPRAADFLILGTRHVMVAPEVCANETILASLISSLILGILIHKKPIIALHGGAVLGNDSALVLLGRKGAGKSTAAAALCGRGFRMLCDDIVPVGVDGYVVPGVPIPRLRRDSFERVTGGAPEGRLGDGMDKFRADLPAAEAEAKVLPRGAFLLEPCEMMGFSAERLSGGQKIRMLTEHVQTLDGIDDKTTVMHRLTQAFAKVPVFRIRRPHEGFRIEGLLDLIESEWREQVR